MHYGADAPKGDRSQYSASVTRINFDVNAGGQLEEVLCMLLCSNLTPDRYRLLERVDVMTRTACGRRGKSVTRALLAFVLAGCNQAWAGPVNELQSLAGPGYEWTAPGRSPDDSAPPLLLIAGVPVPPATTNSGGSALLQAGPALDHHLAGLAGTGTVPGAGREKPASETRDPITTSAIVRSVFGSYAIPMRNFPVAARWAKVFRTMETCAETACEAGAESFAALTDGLEGSSFLEKVRAVNLRVNRAIRYRDDSDVYGRFDHWASPGDVLSKRAGDCEDFVILKMAALMKAGIPARSMSLVVLQIRGKGVFHAVLSVNTSSGALVLDNVTDAVVPDTRVRDYTPLYSMSVDRAWLHGTQSTGTEVASNNVQFGAIAPGGRAR
jgi:predicted transglutaminase-like cysteine proteinase